MPPELTIHPQFIANLVAGLAHWQVQIGELTDADILRLDARRQNLARIVAYGLNLVPTQPAAATIILQAFPLIEKRGYWQEWLPLLTSAVAACSPSDIVLKAELLNRLGELYRLTRQLPLAIDTHLQAAALIEQTDEDHLRHRIGVKLSTAYVFSREYALAEQYGQQALAGFRAIHAPPEFRAAVLNTLGSVAWQRGQLERAETRLRQALILWREAKQPTERLRTLNNLIGTLRAAKKYEAIQPCYEEALSCFPHLAGEFEKTLIEVSYGGALYEQGRYKEAEVVFHRANSAYLQQSPHFYYRATVAQCLGNTLLKQQGRLGEAASYLEESARLWHEVDDDLMLANTLGALAELYGQQGNPAEAALFYEDALALLVQYPDDAWAKKLTTEFQRQRQELD
ncbi:MAG: tetratricopeptide repeat protein [Chloroflexi bacterium]|nr:tetratricopeptide repeat protein [Chloroflexota bacterium]